jgi:diguanylate cyclase (GGDEF)-like protein/PAS domain S-box-containing protein
VPVTARERISSRDPIQRLRVLAALTSNIALNSARTIAAGDDRNISSLITMQAVLGVGGLLASLLLAWGLLASTRRRTVHFRSLVNASTDLVAVLGAGGCRYVSRSLATLVGRPDKDLLREGFDQFVHPDDEATVASARAGGGPGEVHFRVRNAAGEWRTLEAHVTDLRADRHVAGVVLNARDISERVALEREMTQQAEREKFGSQLIEALEMADDEDGAYEVVEIAMSEVSGVTPMELLLADSSRAHLQRVTTSPTAGAPGCPVQSPFSCAAVRRGSAVVFDSSEALNACPKLRARPSGACSAACVPVGFMGRALGVLHVTGPEGQPPAAQTIEQLTTLATQAGARIGTLRAFQRSQLQAGTDGLTGLPNRRAVQTELRRLIKGDETFALAFADLDRFKELNDKHGHESGDRALRLFAQVCQTVLRDGDTVARWGGEEFVMVMPGLRRRGAVAVLERLRERLAESHTGSHPKFTSSFGVTDSDEAGDLEELIHIADAALYEAKAAGRDAIKIGKPSLSLDDARAPDSQEPVEEPAKASRRKTVPLHDAVAEEEPAPIR